MYSFFLSFFFGFGTLHSIWLRSSYMADPWENNLHKLEFQNQVLC